MSKEINGLNSIKIDVLKEIGNIGAGNAATAMARILNKKVNMKVPKVMILSFNEVADALGGADKLMAGIYLQLEKRITGSILFLLSETDANKLLDIFAGSFLSETKDVKSMQESALIEIGNILTGAYLTALSDLIKINLFPSVPALATDMVGALLSVPLSRYAYFGDTALLIDTELEDGGNKVKGHFLLIPDDKSLAIIFEALGVEFNDIG
jgi:chemotaxis protein CheC